MVLNIKDAETDRLAREVAAATGETITVAIRVSLEERAGRLRRAERRARSSAEIGEIIRLGRAGVDLADRPVGEILGYDDDGLPA